MKAGEIKDFFLKKKKSESISIELKKEEYEYILNLFRLNDEEFEKEINLTSQDNPLRKILSNMKRINRNIRNKVLIECNQKGIDIPKGVL
jgi:hypothetical protein